MNRAIILEFDNYIHSSVDNYYNSNNTWWSLNPGQDDPVEDLPSLHYLKTQIHETLLPNIVVFILFLICLVYGLQTDINQSLKGALDSRYL